MEKTLAIIKPDAVHSANLGGILSLIEKSELKVIACKMKWLSIKEASDFYAVHKERNFFLELIKFMTSGPVMILVLEGENAINVYRELMGATDPKRANPGTIRNLFASSIDANAVHGSDSQNSASFEINYFFPLSEIYSQQQHS